MRLFGRRHRVVNHALQLGNRFQLDQNCTGCGSSQRVVGVVDDLGPELFDVAIGLKPNLAHDHLRLGIGRASAHPQRRRCPVPKFQQSPLGASIAECLDVA